MSKIWRTRLFSIVLMVAFLATSTLTRATAIDDAVDFESNQEEQFEDKSETGDKDDKNNSFTSNFFFICEVSHTVSPGTDDFDSTYTSTLLKTAHPVPLFLWNCSFLI